MDLAVSLDLKYVWSEPFLISKWARTTPFFDETGGHLPTSWTTVLVWGRTSEKDRRVGFSQGLMNGSYQTDKADVTMEPALM